MRSIGNFQGLNLNQGDKNLLIGTFRNSWSPRTRSGSPNSAIAMSFGGNDPLLFGHRVGYLFSGTYSYSQDARTDQVRALANRGSVEGSTTDAPMDASSESSSGDASESSGDTGDAPESALVTSRQQTSRRLRMTGTWCHPAADPDHLVCGP